MKKYIKSTEIPDGYLKTSRFTAPSIKTREQRNALEALEIAIVEKFPQFDRFCDRQVYFTSSAHWQGVIDEYESGYYIQLTATQSAFNAFVAKPISVLFILLHIDFVLFLNLLYKSSSFSLTLSNK